MATESENKNIEHQQVSERRLADVIKINVPDETATEDLADNAARKVQALSEPNKSILSSLEKVIEDDPTVDLWLNLRQVTRDYRAKREEYVGNLQSQDDGEQASYFIVH